MLFSRKYKITIAEPCHESWEGMLLSGKGRFCNSCEKQVTDFTGMTEKEIAVYFRNRPKNTCGRLSASQMEKVYTANSPVKEKSQNRFFAFVLSLFVSNAVVEKAIAQTDTTRVVQNDSIEKIVINDTAKTDSIAVAENCDSLASEDSGLVWTVDSSELIINPEPYKIELISVTTGSIAFAPVQIDTGPSFMDLFKKKVKDTRFSKSLVRENDFPESPEKPKEPEKEKPVMTAVLPEELKRRSLRNTN